MKGSVTKKKDGRANPWYGIVERPKDPETGRRRQRWSPGFNLRREAQAWVTETLGTIQHRTYVEPTKTTVGEFLERRWLPARRLAPSTLQLYETIVRAYIVPRIGPVQLQELSTDGLQRLYSELEAGGGSEGRPLAPKTVRHVHTVIRKALADAVGWGLLVRNPAAGAEVPKAVRPELRTWSAGELGAFLEHVAGPEGDPRLYPAFLVLGTTGLRRGELLGLRWEDVDLTAGRLQVRRALVLVAAKPTLSGTKTGRGRSIPLDPQAVAALRELWKLQASDRLRWAEGYEETGHVFTTPKGAWLHPERFADRFHALSRDAGLPRIRVHDLRHTWATLALQAGVPAKVVQEILGHKSIGITLDIYSHVVPSMAEDATSKVAALVFGGDR